jgi:ApaG protein
MSNEGYEAITRKVRVRVTPAYYPERSEPERSRYFWLYSVEIGNEGAETVQLLSRYWRIVDGNGQVQEVRGAGVVGEQPVIAPGESYQYTSGCPLPTPSGFMSGSYQMVAASGERYEVKIPAFSLDSPFVSRSVN